MLLLALGVPLIAFEFQPNGRRLLRSEPERDDTFELPVSSLLAETTPPSVVGTTASAAPLASTTLAAMQGEPATILTTPAAMTSIAAPVESSPGTASTTATAVLASTTPLTAEGLTTTLSGTLPLTTPLVAAAAPASTAAPAAPAGKADSEVLEPPTSSGSYVIWIVLALCILIACACSWHSSREFLSLFWQEVQTANFWTGVSGGSFESNHSHSHRKRRNTTILANSVATESTSGMKVFEWVEKRNLMDYGLDVNLEIEAKHRKASVDDLIPCPPPWTKDYMMSTLQQHGVDTLQFESQSGGSRTIEELLRELRDGEATLKESGSELPGSDRSVIWFASVVVLTVWSADGEAVLQEGAQSAGELPEARIQAGKDPTETLEEYLSRQMGLPTSAYRIKDCDLTPVAEFRRPVTSGLVAIKEIYDAEVQLTSKGVKPRGSKGSVLNWIPRQEASDMISHKKTQRADLTCKEISTKTLHPWGVQQLEEICKKQGVVELLEAKKGSKNVGSLAEELDQGRCRLMLKRDGGLVRVVDLVKVLLWSNPPGHPADLRGEFNTFLVETSHQVSQDEHNQKAESRWPGHKKREDETPAQAAEWMLHQEMMLQVSEVEQTRDPVFTCSETVSSGYAGLKTFYFTEQFVFHIIDHMAQHHGHHSHYHRRKSHAQAPSLLLAELHKARGLR
jgi:hypothetical protein